MLGQLLVVVVAVDWLLEASWQIVADVFEASLLLDIAEVEQMAIRTRRADWRPQQPFVAADNDPVEVTHRNWRQLCSRSIV